VYDLSGNPLRSLPFPQIQKPSGIGIAPDGTKFVLDVALRSIHQIDSSDSYVGSFALTLPSDVSLVSGNVVVGPDGNLLLGVSDSVPTGSASSDTYVKKITKTGTEIWSVAVPILPNANFMNLAVDTSGRVYVLRSTRLEIWDTNGNPLSRIDLAQSTQDSHAGMTSVGDQIYFCFANRIYVVSPN
jgi:sugar lactone lactonase YvrE